MPIQTPSGRGSTTSGRGCGRMQVHGISKLEHRGVFFTPPRIGKFVVRGVTRDSADAVLASCIVKLFRVDDDLEVGETTSNGSGQFSFEVSSNGWSFYLVAYKSGGGSSANRTGASDITITATSE